MLTYFFIVNMFALLDGLKEMNILFAFLLA